jgi:hypothetical protein
MRGLSVRLNILRTPVTRLITAALAAALVVLALSAPAEARRSVPANFMGANWDGEFSMTAPARLRSSQFAKMAASGVETVRTQFLWAMAQPQKDGAIDLNATDSFVGMAAAHHIEVLPTVIVAPAWARQSPDDPLSPPSTPYSFRPYVHDLIERYGPRGSFWTEHPKLPKLPIRYWQFWNEPHLPYQWTVPQGVDWASSYVWELGAFRQFVKGTDPSAKVVLAGLANRSPNYLNDLYKAGVKGLFDVATIHPYTVQPAGVVTLVRRFRSVMRHHGEGKKPVWVTELGLPSSRGRAHSSSTLQTTPSGMAKFLTRSYALLAKKLRTPAIRATRVYWYTWASEYTGDIFRFTGLFRYRSGKLSAQPAYQAYVRTARGLEGCVKSTRGVCS